MPAIVYEVLANDSRERCDRCKSMDWQRLAIQVRYSLTELGEIAFPLSHRKELPQSRTYRFIICVSCLGFAVQAASGWNLSGLLERYRKVSPLYGSVPVVDEPTTQPKKGTKSHVTQKSSKPVRKANAKGVRRERHHA